MTFDEAEIKVENLVGDLNIPLGVEGTLLEVIEILRDKYAPTVEMTSEQYKAWNTALERSKKHKGDFIYFIDVLDDESSFQDNVFKEKLERFINDSKPLMQAWLHPETIKIVDE